MKVHAKCARPAWDNPFLYQPGRGPLPGGLYEIEHDGPLALMKSAGKWVFEFDRDEVIAAELAAEGVDTSSVKKRGPLLSPLAPHDYTCKRCGVVFPNLNSLGQHSRKCLIDTAVAEANEATAEAGA